MPIDNNRKSTAVNSPVFLARNLSKCLSVSVPPECGDYSSKPNSRLPFGPFAGALEAKIATKGFVEDLESEFAQGIKTKIERHSQPASLTIEQDLI